MALFFASGNNHKKIEIQEAFPDIKIMLPNEIGISFDCNETGNSFCENSLQKALYLYEKLGKAVLADDSGICVDALDGRPGIKSARYGAKDGVELSSNERNALLLKEMNGKTNRTCRFVCCMTLLLNKNSFFCIQECCEGVLLEKTIGEGGFGYDPIVFIPELNKSVAQLSANEKNEISHRGKAIKRLKYLLKDPEILALL